MKARIDFRSILALVAILAVLLPILATDTPWPTEPRDYLAEHAEDETGAKNIVSAIYLGYRVFDTMGETIVLLVAVLGTIGILTKAGSLVGDTQQTIGTVSAFSLSAEKRRSNRLRTHLLEVVTGKVGPIVLLFGFYVMLYGHLSPGGGFQGGVIIASGIVFLALGNQRGETSHLSNSEKLVHIETIAFLLLVIVSSSGLITGSPFFGNPLDHTAVPVGYIVVLNAVIGLKVGTSMGFLCIAMMGGTD